MADQMWSLNIARTADLGDQWPPQPPYRVYQVSNLRSDWMTWEVLISLSYQIGLGAREYLRSDPSDLTWWGEPDPLGHNADRAGRSIFSDWDEVATDG